MEYTKFRKHPRIYHKKAHNINEKSVNLSGLAALGILALTFAKGMFWGYIIKKKIG